METTPIVTKTVEVAGISPLTEATAAQDTNNLGNTSPVGSTGTEKFADYLESESSDIGEQQLSPVKVEPQKTPKKTVLPFDYDGSTGNTPHQEGWRVTNHRVNYDRRNVPGHTSTPSKPPGPFYVDTPPSSK